MLPDRLEATLRDLGDELPEDLTGQAMPDELAESGLGIPLAQAGLDELTYRREADANVWTLVRLRRPGAGV